MPPSSSSTFAGDGDPDMPEPRPPLAPSSARPEHSGGPPAEITIPSGPIKGETPPELGTFPSGRFHLVLASIPPAEACLPPERSTECILHEGMCEQILAIPGFPTRPPPLLRVGYEIRPSEEEGQGMAMYALSDFNTGDIILRERPLLVFTRAMPVSLQGQNPDQILEMAVDRLEDDDKRSFFSLANCKNKGLARVRGIVETNTLYVGALPGHDGQCGAICEKICRANHSCSPNTIERWDLPSFSFELRARRPIRKGDELTITYIDTVLTRAERQKLLRDMYGFRCTCAACCLASADAKRSDLRRTLIAGNRKIPYDDADVRQWAADLSAPDEQITRFCAFAVELLDQEQCFDEEVWPACVQRMCKAYCALGRRDEAQRWARRGAELYTAFTGSDGGWLAVAEHPERTAWWGRRLRRMQEGADRPA